LDVETNKKLKIFVVMNDISYSEVVRVLLRKSKLKDIKNKTRDSEKIDSDSKSGKTNIFSCYVYLSDEVVLKLKKLHIETGASYSEIIRQLIANTDLSTLKFRTKGENILAGKRKKRK
jgi:predicted nucleic acid-binding protein